MWGLDAVDSRIAIAAMQAMNASVPNAIFSPTFTLTTVVLAAAAVVVRGRVGAVFAAGGMVYLLGRLNLTVAVSVPMTEALARAIVPDDIKAARAI